MKIYSSKFIVLFFALSFNVSGYSQDDKGITDKLFVNWILASTSYVDNNYDTIPRALNHWLLKTFYPSSHDKGKYESFNGSLLAFLDENFQEEILDDKIYFIQEFTGFGCRNDYSFFILSSSGKLIEVYKNFNIGNKWKKGKITNFNFDNFEIKYKACSDYEKTQFKENVFLSLYIITELNKGTVSMKVLLDQLNLHQ